MYVDNCGREKSRWANIHKQHSNARNRKTEISVVQNALGDQLFECVSFPYLPNGKILQIIYLHDIYVQILGGIETLILERRLY